MHVQYTSKQPNFKLFSPKLLYVLYLYIYIYIYKCSEIGTLFLIDKKKRKEHIAYTLYIDMFKCTDFFRQKCRNFARDIQMTFSNHPKFDSDKDCRCRLSKISTV